MSTNASRSNGNAHYLFNRILNAMPKFALSYALYAFMLADTQVSDQKNIASGMMLYAQLFSMIKSAKAAQTAEGRSEKLHSFLEFAQPAIVFLALVFALSGDEVPRLPRFYFTEAFFFAAVREALLTFSESSDKAWHGVNTLFAGVTCLGIFLGLDLGENTRAWGYTTSIMQGVAGIASLFYSPRKGGEHEGYLRLNSSNN